jgi:hypothetical protein
MSDDILVIKNNCPLSEQMVIAIVMFNSQVKLSKHIDIVHKESGDPRIDKLRCVFPSREAIVCPSGKMGNIFINGSLDADYNYEFLKRFKGLDFTL